MSRDFIGIKMFIQLFVTVSLPNLSSTMISTNVSEAEPLAIKLHYVAVHKVLKDSTQVPTNANTFRNHLSKSLFQVIDGRNILLQILRYLFYIR